MGLLPSYRGRGFGKALMLALKDARQVGLARVKLSIYAGNEPTHRLYRSVGFQPQGAKREAIQIDGVTHDVHMLSLILPRAELVA